MKITTLIRVTLISDNLNVKRKTFKELIEKTSKRLERRFGIVETYELKTLYVIRYCSKTNTNVLCFVRIHMNIIACRIHRINVEHDPLKNIPRSHIYICKNLATVGSYKLKRFFFFFFFYFNRSIHIITRLLLLL